MASKIEILIQLKTQLVNFLDELIETFPNETEFVIARIFIKDQLPIEEIMNYIVASLLPLQNMVKERNENFFLNNNVLFEKIEQKDPNKVNYFKQMWLSNKVDNETRLTIWKWFDTFLYLANKYVEKK